MKPWSYLRDLLCLLPDWPVHEILALAPWETTRKRTDVQHTLSINPYRAISVMNAQD